MLKELLVETRSVRRYDQSRKIDNSTLMDIVESVRYCPSAANLQRVRVAIVNDASCDGVFDTLSFAAYLRPWVRPEVGERPVAYLVLLTKTEPDTNLAIDCGIAAEAIALSAREKGIGYCMFRSFNAEKLTRVIGKESYTPVLVISLGYPKEEVVIEKATDSLKYYRDENDVHHVPKLALEDIIL